MAAIDAPAAPEEHAPEQDSAVELPLGPAERKEDDGATAAGDERVEGDDADTAGEGSAGEADALARGDGQMEEGKLSSTATAAEDAPTALDTTTPSAWSPAPAAPSADSATDEAVPPPASRPTRRYPPAPKKGILRPPSSSHAASSRFSFRRDFLQPFGSSYSRAGTSSTSLDGGAAAAAVGSVGEAVGNAAATAGGFFGSALKRLAAAAAAPEEPAPAPPAPAPAAPPAPAPAPAPAPPTATAPSQPPAAPALPLPVADLKRVRFRMAALKLVYPINGGTLEPIAPADEGATRERVEREWRVRAAEEGRREVKEGEKEARRWTGEELGRLYAECCRTREEPGIERVKRVFRDNPAAPPKALDLSNELLSHGAVEALSDLLSVDWGLKKLSLEHCGLDDESLRPLLHALLVSASIPTLSLAGNKRIRARGWKYVAVFVRKATFLRYLDLSETSLDRRAAEYLVQAVSPAPPPPAPPPPPPLTPAEPPAKANGAVNGGGKKGKVAGPWDEDDDSDEEGQVAVKGEEAHGANGEAHGGGDDAEKAEQREVVVVEPQEEEEEEEEERVPPSEPLFDTAPLLKEDWSGGAASVLSLRLENCGLRGPALEVLAAGIRVSEVKHISLRKNRINAAGAVPLAVLIRDYPLSSDPSSTFTSSSTSPLAASALFTPSDSPASSPFAFEPTNSVSARQHRPLPPAPATSAGVTAEEDAEAPSALAEREAWRLSEARTRLRKQLDGLPRIGALLTLDVKGNDIRTGVTYIAQVLKRNRTLKVLNLGENKIDAQGLIALAEALKFNTTLETLDMGHNPCCGPAIDGILALRSAMMVSPSLKRVFLNSTDLSSEGAIALAEFLPEAHSLLHLDLTNNNVDISGVLALSVSIKLNSTIRCLDINIPFDDPDFSRLSQDLLETCVRNTELAQAKADAEARTSASSAAGKRVVVAQPIRKSALASNLEARQQAEERRARRRADALRAQGDIFAAAAETRDVVSQLLAVDQAAGARTPSGVVRDALVQLQLAEAQLAEAFSGARQEEQREQAEVLLSELASLLDLAKTMYDRPPASEAESAADGHLAVPLPSAQEEAPPVSPTFSLPDSDDSEDAAAGAAAPAGDAPAAAEELSLPPRPATLDLSTALAPGSPGSPTSPSSATSNARSPLESESRAMVAEESEVFRKGVALGVDEVPDESDDEAEGRGEVSGEELKKELLETTVQRSPRPSFNSDDMPRPSFVQSLSASGLDAPAAE
ncbi:hypothetical protein JCM10449v2_004679 [Rhodotorula kratochvilovae]